jgi:hypothetical protein
MTLPVIIVSGSKKPPSSVWMPPTDRKAVHHLALMLEAAKAQRRVVAFCDLRTGRQHHGEQGTATPISSFSNGRSIYAVLLDQGLCVGHGCPEQ